MLFEEAFFSIPFCVELIPFLTQVRDLVLPTGYGDITLGIFSRPSFVPESYALGLKRGVE